MKFEKIIIPPGWQDSFTKYPNGRTIFEALSNTITTVNEGIEEVNQKVNQGLLSIDQAETIIRNEITESFNILKLQLESEIGDLSGDLLSQWASFQLSVNTQLNDIEQDFNAQLAEKANKVQEAWITPTLLNGATGTIQYRKNQFGRLEFKGSLKHVSGSTPFLMPTGYRPSTSRYFIPAVVDAGINAQRILIDANGNYWFPSSLNNYTLHLDAVTIILN